MRGVDRIAGTRDSKHSVYALLIAHEKLDAAVAAAYGWAWPLTDDEILAALLALNHERSAVSTGAGREVAQALLQAAPSDAPPTQ